MNTITIIPLESATLLTGLVIIAIAGVILGYWLAIRLRGDRYGVTRQSRKKQENPSKF